MSRDERQTLAQEISRLLSRHGVAAGDRFVKGERDRVVGVDECAGGSCYIRAHQRSECIKVLSASLLASCKASHSPHFCFLLLPRRLLHHCNLRRVSVTFCEELSV